MFSGCEPAPEAIHELRFHESDAASSSQPWSMPRFDPFFFRMQKSGGTTEGISKLKNGVSDNENADGQHGTPVGGDHHRPRHDLDHSDTEE